MHSYSIESSERVTIPFIIALVSILLASAIEPVFRFFELDIGLFRLDLGISLAVPGVFALYGIMYSLFDTYLWRFGILRRISLVKIPNLNGEWSAILSSSLDNYEKNFEMKASITQTWTKIGIFLDGDFSFSYSQMASIEFFSPKRLRISWEYLSDHKPQSEDQDGRHYGLCHLIIELDSANRPTSLEGSYFTDLSRHSYGRIVLQDQ